MSWSRLVILAIFCLTFSAAANAQATRTWISGVGDDVNPCSRTAPCKTFAGAISKTAAGGEINCLDPGGFGAVTVTKSITLDCRAVNGSILASLVNGIIINNSGANVRIRGLAINGVGTGVNGIRILAASRVAVEDVVIDGFTGNGISVESSGDVKVFVSDTTIRNIAGSAVMGLPAVSADIVVTGSRLTANGTGLTAGAGATLRIAGNTISQNTVGLSVRNRGSIVSFGNNANGGNTTDGAPSSTVTLQ